MREDSKTGGNMTLKSWFYQVISSLNLVLQECTVRKGNRSNWYPRYYLIHHCWMEKSDALLAEIDWKEGWIPKATSVIFPLCMKSCILHAIQNTLHHCLLSGKPLPLVLAVCCGSSALSFSASLLTHDHTPEKSFCLVMDLIFCFFPIDQLMLIRWPVSMPFTWWLLLPRLCCQNWMLGGRYTCNVILWCIFDFLLFPFPFPLASITRCSLAEYTLKASIAHSVKFTCP